MNPKKALYFSIGIRMLMVFFCISICFVKFLESEDETKQGLMEKEKLQLVIAAEKIDIKLCEILLSKGVTPDGRLADGATALHVAALNSQGDKSFGLMKRLLLYNAKPIVKDHEGRIPLHCACTNTKNIARKNEAVGLLLLYGSDIKAENNQGRDILADMVTLQSKENIEDFMMNWGYLISKESLDRARRLAGDSAGVGLGYTDINKLLNKYYSINQEALLSDNVKRTGFSVLFYKVLRGDCEFDVDKAAREGLLDIFLPERYEKLSLLFVAILRGEKKLVKRMLKNKIGIDYVDVYRRNALHMIVGSCLFDEKEKIKLLDIAFKSGYKSISDINGDTILHISTRNNYVEIVKFLLVGYKDMVYVEKLNVNGDRAFDIASRYGNSKIMGLLK